MTDEPTQQQDAPPLCEMQPLAHTIRCFATAAIVFSVFMVVYGGSNYITSLRDQRVRVDFDFEQNLPFVPELTLVYSSHSLMYLAMPLVLRSKREIRRFATVMIIITVAAGLCFLVVPAETRFRLPDDLGRFPTAFHLADSTNLTYNLCPSLHVAYAVTCAEFVRGKYPRIGWSFHIWALAIAISAWVTYQHHLLDLVAGYALSLAATHLPALRIQ